MINKIIALDDGHGMETAGKRTPLFEDGSFMKENEFNRAVINYLDIELKRCGFGTLLVAEGDTDVSLTVRTNIANNYINNKYNKQADLYISVHANASTGSWNTSGGIETYIYTYTDSNTEDIAHIIHKNLLQGTSLKDRGVKRANFHVLRETLMPAVLVECGFMDNKQEALLLLSDSYRKECASEIAQAVCEIYGVDYINEDKENLTEIIGTSVANVQQLVSYTLKNNPAPKLPYCTLEQLAQIFIEEGETENIRGDIAFAQSLKETGFFKYGGIVNPDMNNFAGIGALNGNKNGNAAKFDNPRLGVKAQIQHLKAYACNEKLTGECVDPRFNLVKRNSAPFVEWLGTKDNPNKVGWAYPGKGYGKEIIEILNNIIKEPVEEKPQAPQWQVNAFKALKSKNVFSDDNYWNRLDDKITIGECMALLNRMGNAVEENILEELLNIFEKRQRKRIN